MSRFLSEPITKKESGHYTGSGFNVGKTSMQGWRDTMEDVEIVQIPLSAANTGTSCFGVFDGHGGSQISQAASKSILHHIMETEDYKANNKSAESLAMAICKGFIATDKALQMNPEYAASCDEIGSTGLLAFVTPTDIIVGNVGDSRCILSNLDTQEVIQLSVDHKPELEFEKQRILAAGGTVFRGRVCGGVAVSRSFGDFWFKRNAALKPHQQLVTAEPCIRIHRRHPNDEFLVLCCDGIYDVMSNDQVRRFIRHQLKNGIQNPKEICEALVDECLAKGSRDNMSVVLVLF